MFHHWEWWFVTELQHFSTKCLAFFSSFVLFHGERHLFSLLLLIVILSHLTRLWPFLRACLNRQSEKDGENPALHVNSLQIKSWNQDLKDTILPTLKAPFFSLWGVYTKGEFLASICCWECHHPCSSGLQWRLGVWAGKTVVGAITYVDLLILYPCWICWQHWRLK